jgi:ABC-2 type transport system ATP-binding protein
MLAVNDVSIKVHEGEAIALLGPNGAGKTTLLEMLEGITAPSSGLLNIFGLNYQESADQIRNSIGVSLQETQFYDRQTVAETVRLFMSFYKLPIKHLEHTLERFNLKMIKDKFVMHLSGGQKQRLSLAIAMVHQPKILFLDEPTTGLDPAARATLWKLIRELISEGLTLLLTTHYMEEAEELCDRILLLNNGKVLSDGTIPELMTRLPGTQCVRFSYSSPIERRLLEQVPGIKGIEINHDSNLVTLDVDDAKKAVSYFIKEDHFYKLKDFSITKRTLNDVFLSLTGTNLYDG